MMFCSFILVSVLALFSLGSSDLTDNIYESDDGLNDFDPVIYDELSRGKRDIEGSAYDYVDNDDEDMNYWARPRSQDEGGIGEHQLMSSRVVPVSSSPSFTFPAMPNTRLMIDRTASYYPGTHNLEDRTPARPNRLSSYYPGMMQEDGSGSGPDDVISVYGELNDTDMINPTRPQYPVPSSSIVVSGSDGPAAPVTNHQPFIANRLDKLALVAGKSSRIIIPANTFQDLEDGDTRDLSLSIVQSGDGADLDSLGWIRFDPGSQEIVALPLDNNAGTWKFRVLATDKGGESVLDILEMKVRQHSSSRVFHHTFILTVAPVNVWKFKHPMDWKLTILERIYQYFGDQDPGKISVLDIREEDGNFRFSWTNDTMQLQKCPRDEISALFSRMHTGKKVAPGFKSFLAAEFHVKDVELSWSGMCSERRRPPGSPPVVPASGFDNSMPQIQNPVDSINIMAGELLMYQVPEDMCYDSENGETRYLDLSLLTPQRLEVATTNWLQFDKKNQEFYGVPLEMDVGREAYQLVCADSQGLMAIDGIEVHVVSRPFDERFNMEFVFVFNETLDDGNRLLASRVKLSQTIAKIFNDPDTSNIVLKNVDPVNFEVTWYNKTIKDRECPWKYLKKAKNFLLDKDGKPRPHVVNNFPGEFHLSDIKMIPTGFCVTVNTPDPTEDPEHPLLIPHHEYILTFVVPALIIIAMLLFAILIACLLHRKRRAGKMEIFKTESLPPRIPVIMQDELSDDNFNLSKQPIILREEHPGTRSMGSMGGGLGYQQHDNFGQPPNYYGSGRMEEEFSECESLVNGSSGMPHLSQYSRPPPVSLEFSDSLARNRNRPAPAYRKHHQPQHFNP